MCCEIRCFRTAINAVTCMLFTGLLSSLVITQVNAQCPRITVTETCEPYSLRLKLTGGGLGAGSALTWTVQRPMNLPFADLGLDGELVPGDNTTYEIKGVPRASGDFDISISVAAGAGTTMPCGAGCPEPMNPTTCTATTASLAGVRMHLNVPVDVMLVLDVSGSMSQFVPSGNANPPTMTKWEVLKEAAKAFLEAYQAIGKCNYKIGAVYFDGSRRDFSGGALVPISNIGALITDMGTKSPGSTTCLGGGILAGYQAFSTERFNRHMLIFTDGLQNNEPMVSEATGTYMVINDYNVRPDGSGFPAPPLDLKLPARRFDPHTIAIGGNAVTNLLQNIALAPNDPSPAEHNYNGAYYPIEETENLIGDLHNHFTNTFVQMLLGFSPQLVDIREITVANSSLTKFIVNESADKLIIKVVSNPERMVEARIRIEKDGRDLSSLVRTGGKTYKSFYIDTKLIRRYNIPLDGTYNVRVTGPSGQYQITCLVDDEKLEATASLGIRNYAPGDTIPLEGLLRYDTLPITNASKATVWIAKPGQDVNDLFSQAGEIDIPENFPGEPGNDPGQSKYEALIALDPAFVAALQPVHDSIPLIHDSNGRYSARFADTKESGVYSFVFRFAGNDTTTGPYERFILQSTVVDFGLSDHIKTIFQIISKEGMPYFQLIPKNKFDHLLGPNRLGQITLLVNGQRTPLTDNLDGSYEAQVPSFPIFTPDPKVEVDIKGDPFYSDDYSDITGSDVSFWSKYWFWIIIVLLVILILIIIIRWL